MEKRNALDATSSLGRSLRHALKGFRPPWIRVPYTLKPSGSMGLGGDGGKGAYAQESCGALIPKP
ncbi:hypothetical protein KEJ19_06950 [Candidatus Bathyarchaeota archaeon]|nr:hypothetical protein [Candidatus Bathyarchaeota archaeon]